MSEMSKQYGVLLVGGAQSHLENYGQDFVNDSRCRVVALADEVDISPRQQRLNQQLAEVFGVPYWEDLKVALASDEIEIVVVCVEPERRARVAQLAVEAGKPLYVDKPLCTNVSEAKQLVTAAEKSQQTTQMFSLVRHPLAAMAKEKLQQPDFGKLIGLHCELMFAKGISGTANLLDPRVEKEIADRFSFTDSKRELFCVGLYPLVLFEWLMHSPAVSVYAQTNNYFFKEHQQNDVEDFAMLQLEYANGVQATITAGRAGWSSHPSHGVHQLDLVGTNRTISLDGFKPRLEIYSDAPAWVQPEVGHPEDPMGFWSSTVAEAGVPAKEDWLPLTQALPSDASCFLDCVDQNKPSDVPIKLAAHVIQVFEASYRSASLGEQVEIEPI